MKPELHQQRSGKARRTRRLAFARLGLLMAAAAYFFTVTQIAPLAFSCVGMILDSDHQARVSIVDGSIRVTLAHNHPGNHHQHKYAWLSSVIVGSTQGGHPDHTANFESAGNGQSSESGEVDVKCPVSEMPDFQWLTLVASSHATLTTGIVSFENSAPPDIRPMRPVTLLI